MRARADVPNIMGTNGESLVQRELVAFAVRREHRLTVIDVGANTGEWTLSLIAEAHRAGIGQAIQIHAFEPAEDTFRILEARIGRENGGPTVRCIQCAVSSSEGFADLHVMGPGAGTNSMHADPARPAQRVSRIPKITLDRYCAEEGIAEVDYVKCDAEGHDFEVLQGARGLLESGSVGVFQFEYNHRWIYASHYLMEVFRFAEGRRYRIGKLTPDGLEFIMRWHPELERYFEANFALVRDDLIGAYTHRDLTLDNANTFA